MLPVLDSVNHADIRVISAGTMRSEQLDVLLSLVTTHGILVDVAQA